MSDYMGDSPHLGKFLHFGQEVRSNTKKSKATALFQPEADPPPLAGRESKLPGACREFGSVEGSQPFLERDFDSSRRVRILSCLAVLARSQFVQTRPLHTWWLA